MDGGTSEVQEKVLRGRILRARDDSVRHAPERYFISLICFSVFCVAYLEGILNLLAILRI